MNSTQSTGDRRLTPSQSEALGKFVPNPFPPARTGTPVRQPTSEPLPIRPRMAIFSPGGMAMFRPCNTQGPGFGAAP